MSYKSKNIYTLILMLLILICCSSLVLAQTTTVDSQDNQNLYWKPKLEYAFTKTFSSSHEFAACQVFQKLDYDLAEIAEIRKITPFPASLTVEYEGLQEETISNLSSENGIGSQTKVLKFEKLNVICDKVHYFDMVIERVIFGFPQSSIELDYLDKGRLKFVKAKNIELNIKVSEADIVSVVYLYPKSKLLSNVKVELTPGKCQSRGRVKLGLLVADFRLRGFIKQISPKRVNFSCDKLYINGISQPRAFVKSIMNYVNPVYDSSKIWINLNVNEMNIVKGYVETKATIDKKELKHAN